MCYELCMIHFQELRINNKTDIVFVYADDIVVNRNDITWIQDLKAYLRKQFEIKDLSQLQYFFGIEVVKGLLCY